MNPVALRKAKIVYNFGLSECNRVKKINCAFKGHKDHIFAIFSYFFFTVKSRYMHSEKKKFQKKERVSYLPTLFFLGCNLNHAYFFIWLKLTLGHSWVFKIKNSHSWS